MAPATRSPVAKRRSSQEPAEQPADKPKRRNVDIAPDLLKMAGIVAIQKETSLKDYIDSLIRPQIIADYQAFLDSESRRKN